MKKKDFKSFTKQIFADARVLNNGTLDFVPNYIYDDSATLIQVIEQIEMNCATLREHLTDPIRHPFNQALYFTIYLLLGSPSGLPLFSNL